MRFVFRPAAPVLAVLLGSSLGCTRPPADAGRETGADAGARPPCVEQSAARPCVREAVGRFVDEHGEPLRDTELVSICGPICFAGDMQADGSFTVPIDRALDIEQYSALLHGRPRYAGFYFPVSIPKGAVLEMGDLTAIELPEAGPAFPVPSPEATQVQSGPVTLHLPTRAEAYLDFDALAGGEVAQRLRVREVDRELFDRFEELPADAVSAFAFGPFETYWHDRDDETRQRLRIGLTLPNPNDAAPGAHFHVFVLGSYLYPDYVSPARFERVASAVVSDDGAQVKTPAGEGIELLTWVAIVPSAD